MEKKRDLKNFTILTTEPNFFSQIKKLESQKTLNYNGNKIFKNIHSLGDDFFDIELFWEATKEIESEALNEFGDVEKIPQIIKTVVKTSILGLSSSNVVYMFARSPLVTRQAIDMLQAIVSIEFNSVRLNNNFYSNILNNHFFKISRLSYQSLSQINNYTISNMNSDEYFLNQVDLENNAITNASIFLDNFTRIRISSTGRVSLYNFQGSKNMREIINIIDTLLIESGIAGGKEE